MITNGMDAEVLVLDQTFLALVAEGFAMFQELVDNPPSDTAGLRRTLTSKAPWVAMVAGMRKSNPEL